MEAAQQQGLAVRRRLRRAAERRDPFDHLGIQAAPLIGLLRTHRPPDDERYFSESEQLGGQAVLCGDVIEDRDDRKPRAIVWCRGVAR